MLPQGPCTQLSWWPPSVLHSQVVAFQAWMGPMPAEEVILQSTHCSYLPVEAGYRRAGRNSLWASFIDDIFYFVYLYWFSSLQNDGPVLTSFKHGSQSQTGMRSGGLCQEGSLPPVAPSRSPCRLSLHTHARSCWLHKRPGPCALKYKTYA